MITIYPDQFNMRENGSYSQLDAIKGDTGPQGPQGEPGAGIGTAEYVPQVILSEVQPSVANGTVWMKLLSTDTGYTLGNVMCGTTETLPTTRWNGSALQKGDVYIVMAGVNSHPVTWGSLTFCPFKCYLRSSSAWAYKEAEVYVNNAWWPLNTEWLVESGEILAQSSIPTEGSGKFTTTHEDGMLVLTASTTVTSRRYLCATFGVGNTSPCVYKLYGEIVTNVYNAKFGLTAFANAGESGNERSFFSSVYIPANNTVTNPAEQATSSTSVQSVGFECSVLSGSPPTIIRIRHLCRTFTS